MAPADTEQAERAAFAAVGYRERREVDAVKFWIAGGCSGPRPQPEHEERTRATKRLVEANEAIPGLAQDVDCSV